MPRFFNVFKRTSIAHNKVQISNSIVQILSTNLEPYAPSLVIPGTVAQTIGSIYAIAHNDSSTSEKVLHSLQGLIALGRLALAITLMFENQKCDYLSHNNMCIASQLLQLIYSGIASAGLALSALSKDSKPEEEERSNLSYDAL